MHGVLLIACMTGVLHAQHPTTSLDSTDVFARYVTPGQCEQAAFRLQRQYWRDKRPDTVVYAPATDSVPLVVITSTRMCAARFDIATVSPSELSNLARLYLWTGQDTLAQRAMTRLLTVEHGQPASERGWELYRWVTKLLDAHPSRVAMARSALAQLDTLGAPVAVWRSFGHASLARYLISVNESNAAEAEARAALEASRRMGMEDRVDWLVRTYETYMTLTTSVGVTRGRSAALAVLDTMQKELLPLRPADQQMWTQNIAGERALFSQLETRGLPPVHATQWYGAQGDTIRPRSGQVSLLVFVFGGGDYPMHATLRRLHAKYGVRGLDITLMSRTQGYFRTLLTPSSTVEADSLGSYLLHFLKLPAAVAVEASPFSHLADGRRRDQATTNQQAYRFSAVLVDRHGVIRWVSDRDVRPANEAVWDAVIQKAIDDR